MSITVSYADLGRTCGAILRPAGALDRSNYEELIAQAWAARDAGARYLIVDLSDVERVSVAGLVGLRVVARLAHAPELPDPKVSWAVIGALAQDDCPIGRLAVVNPRPPIQQTLARAPFSDFLAIHADLDSALAALAA